MTPKAHVSHRMPHRLRIKIPSKKKDVSYFATLMERLSGCPGVKEIRVNPDTGSALIFYEGERKAIAEFANKNDLFVLGRSGRPQKPLFDNVSDTFKVYNRQLKTATGGELDIPSLVFLSLLISGIWEIARGNFVMPAWYTAFYYAAGVFTRARVDEWDEGEDFALGADDADGD